jgi:ribonuclease HI
VSRRVHGADTNNVAELEAVLDALKMLPLGTSKSATVVTDSRYVIDAQEWLPGWKRNGWKKADGSPVANLLLIQSIAKELASRPYVYFSHVYAHSITEGNHQADKLAKAGAHMSRTASAENVGC